MRRAAAGAFLLLALLAGSGNAESPGDMTLVLPHPLQSGETAWVQVRVGQIGRGQEIEVTTTSGRELGVISAFGLPAGQDAGPYPLPLPADAIQDGRVSLRLTITQF